MNKDILLEDSLKFLEIKYKSGDYHIDFKVWQVGLKDGKTPEFLNEAASVGPDFQSDRTKATPYIDGSLKWDGCINYRFPGQDTCMLHECQFSSFMHICDIFELIYEEGKILMPMADYE